MRTRTTTRRRLGVLLAPAALLLALTGAVAGAGPQAVAAPTDDNDSTYSIYHITALAPGATTSRVWNNTPQGRSWFVDVRPDATAAPSSCSMEVTRSYRTQNLTIVDGALATELEIHYSVKNVGAVTCDADVYLAYVRAPDA